MSLPPPPPPPPASQDPNILEANGRYGRRREPSSPIFPVLLNVVNVVTQFLLGGVAVAAILLANIFQDLSESVVVEDSMSQHIYLCVIGYVVLMGQAILSLNSYGWTFNLKDQDKRLVHGVMQIVGSMLAISGSLVRIVDLDEHFNSAHAVLGIVAMILTFFSLLGGLLNFIIPLQTSSNLYKTLHACVGSLTISVAFICLCFGFNKSSINILLINIPLIGDVNINFSIALTVFALAGILVSAGSGIVKRIIYGE